MWNRISCPNELRLCALLTLLVAACGGSESAPAISGADTSVVQGTGTGAATDTSCRKTGAWQACSVLDRLEHAGLVVTVRPEPTRLPFFSVEGTTYETTRSQIHVFLYPDEGARERDTSKLDNETVAPRGETHAWGDPVALVTSNNLAAVVVSPNERQMERIVLALGAGLPR